MKNAAELRPVGAENSACFNLLLMFRIIRDVAQTVNSLTMKNPLV